MIITIILTTITTLLVVGSAIALFIWFLDSPNHLQYIKFNNFESLYAINPSRWELHCGYVEFIKEKTHWSLVSNTIMFRFNFTDYYHYQFWKHSLKKQQDQERHCKELQEVISILKSDLAKFEDQNAKRMNKEAENILNIAKNIRGDILFKCEGNKYG